MARHRIAKCRWLDSLGKGTSRHTNGARAREAPIEIYA
jgi:hypothetical protein